MACRMMLRRPQWALATMGTSGVRVFFQLQTAKTTHEKGRLATGRSSTESCEGAIAADKGNGSTDAATCFCPFVEINAGAHPPGTLAGAHPPGTLLTGF